MSHQSYIFILNSDPIVSVHIQVCTARHRKATRRSSSFCWNAVQTWTVLTRVGAHPSSTPSTWIRWRSPSCCWRRKPTLTTGTPRDERTAGINLSLQNISRWWCIYPFSTFLTSGHSFIHLCVISCPEYFQYVIMCHWLEREREREREKERDRER